MYDVWVRTSRSERRVIFAPRASFEEIEVRTRDGATLRGVVDDPPIGTPLRGTMVLAHAMFARKSSFGRRDRPGLSAVLQRLGLRTIAFDFRGHGDSTCPRGETGWSYDDLIQSDLPAVVDSARARGDGRPVLVLGHSLGGHVALAMIGTEQANADAVIAVGTNVWLRDLERSRARWAAKVAVTRAMLAISKHVEMFPARRIGIGSDDASDRFLRELFRGVTDGSWSSADGVDYLDALSNVKVPVAAVIGDRDRLMCAPGSGESFARRIGGPLLTFHAPVGHMDLVTSPRGWGAISNAVSWALGQVSENVPTMGT